MHACTRVGFDLNTDQQRRERKLMHSVWKCWIATIGATNAYIIRGIWIIFKSQTWFMHLLHQLLLSSIFKQSALTSFLFKGQQMHTYIIRGIWIQNTDHHQRKAVVRHPPPAEYQNPPWNPVQENNDWCNNYCIWTRFEWNSDDQLGKLSERHFHSPMHGWTHLGSLWRA